MRHFNILFAFAFVLLTSCFTDEVDYVGYQPSSKGGIHIVGAVEDYDVKSVGTRADDGGIADSYISEMTMFIFKSNGDLIQGYTDVNCTAGNECTSAINIQRGNPTFLIDTEEGILADLSGGSETDIVYYKNNAGDLVGCNIYIVANAWHQLTAPTTKEDDGNTRIIDTIKSLTDLEAFVYQADDTLAMPTIENGSKVCGFPMIGKQQGAAFDLTKGGNNENNAVATIPLKKLYSKVRFTMQINADQVVAGQTPKFTISQVEVFNVPKMARFGRELDKDGNLVYKDYTKEMGYEGTYIPSDLYYYTNTAEDSPFVIENFNKKTISHSTSLTTDDVIEFGFYMPEHKVTPNPIQLPSTMTPEEKVKYAQYYKPTGVGAVRNGDGTTSAAKIATFVRIHGSYTDHNGQILGVKYDIYLGQNNYDDFTVKRNQQLNNKLIITGLTNHKNAYPDEEHEGNISIDHRVEVSDRGFNLSMERTAILDAHFEVRPLDIELQADASMTVTIPEAYRGWVAMEDDAAASSGKNSSLYVNTSTARKGVRKYFTTNLVSELNAAPSSGTTGNGGTLFFENTTTQTKTFRIWFYVDENPNVYDKTFTSETPDDTNGYTVSKEQYRVCPVQFAYEYKKKDENGEVVEVITKTETINFQQWNLWRVWSAPNANGVRERYYDIEHEEEYLNNYASDLQYGQTQNGMAWGLDGVQLSDDIFASWKQKTSTGWFASIIDAIFNTSGTTSNVFANSGKEPYYDFYLSRDNFPIAKLDDTSDENVAKYRRDYSGIQFNREIATTLKASTNPKAKIDGIILTEDPQSAFAYCYHKNKRNSSGVVETQKWFLPAIDEIEDIALGAYDEFDKVFQNEKYWSCQPAYERYTMKLTGNNYFIGWYVPLDGLGGVLEGEFFIDNVNRARATSVYTTDGTNYTNIQSGTPSTEYGGHLDVQAYKDGPKNNTAEATYSPNTVNYNADIYTTGEYRGNSSRTANCRIRAVYRSGTATAN